MPVNKKADRLDAMKRNALIDDYKAKANFDYIKFDPIKFDAKPLYDDVLAQMKREEAEQFKLKEQWIYDRKIAEKMFNVGFEADLNYVEQPFKAKAKVVEENGLDDGSLENIELSE